MKSKSVAVLAVIGFVFLFSIVAQSKPGPVKISFTERVENHSKTVNGESEYSPETVSFSMLTLSRTLQEGVLGSIFFLNRYSFDESDSISNIGGVNITKIFSAKSIMSLGYVHSSNDERGIIRISPENDNDRFTGTYIRNFNPKEKTGIKYSSITSYGTVSDFAEQQTLTEKLKFSFPIGALEGILGYTYSYNVKYSDQTTNQFDGSIGYKLSKTTKLVLGYKFINNVYDNNPGDDSVIMFTIRQNLR